MDVLSLLFFLLSRGSRPRSHGCAASSNSAPSILMRGFFCLGLSMSSSQKTWIIYSLYLFSKIWIYKKRVYTSSHVLFSSLSRPNCWPMAVPCLQANMECFNISSFFSLTQSISVRANPLSCLSISAHNHVMALLSLQNTKLQTTCRSCLSGSTKILLGSGQCSVFSISPLISIFCQSSVKSPWGFNSWLCCALRTAGAGLYIAVPSFWPDWNEISLHKCSGLSSLLFW